MGYDDIPKEITDADAKKVKSRTLFDNVLVCDDPEYAKQLDEHTLGKQKERQKPLLIVSEDVDSEALTTLILNKIHAGIKVCVVKALGFGENMKVALQDLATLTGGEVVNEELGINEHGEGGI